MTRLREVVKVFDRYMKVSTVPGVYETMVFECDSEGNIFNIENPIIEKHYSSQEEVQKGHENIIEMYQYIAENGYKKEDWKGSFYDNMRVGQFVSDEVVEQLVNCLYPQTYTKDKFQMGERYSSDGYATFEKHFDFWVYVGIQD